MKINIFKTFFIVFFTSISLSSCSQVNKSIDIDLSNLPKPKNSAKPNDTPEDLKNSNNKLIKDLDLFESKDKLLSKYKFGKKDPFSKGGTEFNQFSSNFELLGFLNADEQNYVFVKYLGNDGIISEDSIGGLNTEFLPDGAKVININTESLQLKINFDNENYIFEL